MNRVLLRNKTELAEGPQSGVVQSFVRKKDGTVKGFELETVHGKVQVKLAKHLRPFVTAELSEGAQVRLWIRLDGKRPVAEMFIPLCPLAVVNRTCRETCVMVCGSKSCCRKGGGEQVVEKLEVELKARYGSSVRVKKCGCLSACRKGPSVKIAGRGGVQQIDPCNLGDFLDKHFPSN